jgi:uncharacterized protein with ATP-grasp and redox domains
MMTHTRSLVSKTVLPLPKPMTALDPKSWAYNTVTCRWPEIVLRMFAENDLTPSIKQRLGALILDIPDAPIRSIKDPGAPDFRAWNQDIRVHAGKNWLEPPWFFTEHYFYRRVIDALGFFQFTDGEELDPFAYQKKKGLEVSRVAIRDLISRVTGWKRSGYDRETLIRLLYLDLWGNQADLSMWPAEGDVKPDHSDLEQTSDFLLEDRAADVADYLIESFYVSKNTEELRIDFMVDNAGFELVSDLVFADYLLSNKTAVAVRLHVKSHPTYVSDATIKDVRDTLDFFKTDVDSHLNALGSRLVDYWAQDRLQVRDNFFWTSPLPGWEMPLTLEKELSQSRLVISKGDANYRRLLGDLDWPYITPFADILAYFPAPVVALRTVKAEIACGMQPGQAERVTAEDPKWMIDGRWGVVQFAKSSPTEG